MIAWIVSLMVVLQPVAPWRDSYETTAQGILRGATEEPLFEGEYGILRTVALDVSLAWFESRFDVRAVGDKGKSRGLYQVQAKEVSENAYLQTLQANRMVRESFKVCRRQPLEERLGWYAAGGLGCSRGLRESRHRVWKAQWLLKNFPFSDS